MTLQLLSVLAAAGLVATGIGGASDTRSAQSLPAQNLAVMQTAAPSGKLPAVHRTANRLADAPGAEGASAGPCVKDDRLVDANHLLCHKGGVSTPLAFGLGAAVIAGIAVGVSGHHSDSSNNSVSN